MERSVKEELIKQLASGEFVSGQQIGEKFGITRAAVAKHIKSIADLGLDVFRVTGKGYKLSESISLLKKSKIASFLEKKNLTNRVDVFSLIDSTNDLLMRKVPNQIKSGEVCIAEYQSAGRGRRGRQWVSPFGSNLYFSMYWKIEQGMAAAMGLNIVAALAVSDAIKSLYNIDVQLKWPNDIYLSGVKLAGILIDLDGQALEPCHCVIGIGLNLKMPEESAEKVDQPWTDIATHTEIEIDRNELVAEIIASLTNRLIAHQNQESTFVHEWQTQDYFYNKLVKLISGDKEIYGLCKGIDDQGALMLESEGVIKPMYGGELSLRGIE